ncbi:MAG: radical SAM protein [Thermofilum sp. ex4484_79]|nr:MAG: radical SAM protein [Thermofilum sp. ex4484_79]
MVREVYARTILNRHRRRDEWFLDDYSVNPYQLCDFNCIYCYIRGSKYGENMRHGLAVKINAPTLLRRELARRASRGEYGFIALSSATEPWMHIEEKYEVTRRCLEVIAKLRFPVHCLTKSTLILRDLDLLEEIDKGAILPSDLVKIGHGVFITFSLSTLDEKTAEIFEPHAPRPKERLETLQKVREEGFYAGVAYIPVLPFISDSNEQLEEMVKTAKEFQADYIFVGALTLYGVGKKLYYRVLEKHFPELVPKYKRLFRIFNQPDRSYQLKLEEKARKLCEKLGVRYRIL